MSTFEDAIIQGIVRQFFAPTVFGYNPDGSPMTSPSPAATVAQTFFQQHKDEITKAVLDKLSVDEIAEGVYTRLKEDLQKPLDRYSYNDTRVRKEFDESVRKQVVRIVAEAKAAEMMKEDEAASNE